MSPRRTRRGTIRESVIETSIDSSLRNTSKVTKRSRRVNKSHAKASEDDSDSGPHTEVYSSIESVASASILNETSSKAKKRKRGGVEASESQDISLSVTIEEPKKSNAKTPRAKKQTASSKSRTKASETLPSEGESSNKKPEKRVSYNLMSDSEDQPGVSSRKKAKASKKGKTPDQSPEKVPSKTTSPDKNVTPKTSPQLNVSFTPHRSKKTPRKSPVNLGSPKSHSPNPAKFMLVPRKLSITDSPPSSENSLLQNTSLKAGNESIHNTSKSSKSSKSKLNVSSSKKKSITPFKPRPTFSKSPKIVLKTPKAKSSKKTTPKGSAASAKSKKVSPLKQKKSPVKSDKKSKSGKSTPNESLSITANTSGKINLNETVTITPAKSPKKSANTSVKSPAKATSPIKSKLELLSSSLKSIPKIVLSSVSPKTLKSSKPPSPAKSKSSPKKASPIKSPISPKTKVALISRGTPKIVLVKKSPVKSANKAAPRKSNNTSPSKSKKSPSKSAVPSTSTSEKSSEVPSPNKTEQVEISNSASPAKPASAKKSKKSLSPSKSKKSPVKSARSSLNTSSGLSLSSKKMPKIVLKKKSPLKSAKSATPLSARKSLKVTTAVRTPKVSAKSPRASPAKKADKAPVKQQARKSSPTKNTSKNATMSPKVVVSKLSSPELRNNSLRAKENQPSVALVPVDHETSKSRVSSGRSPKSPKFLVNKKSTSPAKSAKTPMSVAKRSVAAISSSKSTTPTGALNNKFLNLKPKNTSTPREKGKQTRSPLGKSKIIKRLNDQSTIQGEQPFLEDESEPSLDNSSLIRMSDVFDIDSPRKNNTFGKNSNKTKNDTFEVDKSPSNTSRRSNRSGTFEATKASPSPSAKNKSKKNNTYEVPEPKTPGFQNKSVKRTVNLAGLSADGEPSSKKSRKVNFTSPARETTRASSINRIGTPAHPMHRRTPTSVSRTKTPLKSATKSRISGLGLGNKTPASTPSDKRKSITGAALLASVNRLSRPKAVTESQKKLVTKTPVNRKIPNFAEIHQKRFAKMESLVDLKKRVEQRHVVLNAGSAKKGATESTNGAYNRFGFKVRKDEAVNLINKKQTASADSRQQKRENARTALQGVRMNRRFELQMKARTKTS